MTTLCIKILSHTLTILIMLSSHFTSVDNIQFFSTVHPDEFVSSFPVYKQSCWNFPPMYHLYITHVYLSPFKHFNDLTRPTVCWAGIACSNSVYLGNVRGYLELFTASRKNNFITICLETEGRYLSLSKLIFLNPTKVLRQSPARRVSKEQKSIHFLITIFLSTIDIKPEIFRAAASCLYQSQCSNVSYSVDLRGWKAKLNNKNKII